jgi:hypothetical protein
MNETRETIVPRRKWARVGWKRIGLALVLLFVLPLPLVGIAWFLEPWYFAREMSRGNRHLTVTPMQVRDTSLAPLLAKRLEYFEVSFQVPWGQIETQKIAKTAAILQFKGGGALIIFDPAESTTVSRGLHDQTKKLSTVFGPGMMSSGYDWMAGELAANPEQIRWWDRTGDVRLAVLLGLKSMDTLDCDAIFEVGNAELHGFQVCDPTTPPHRVKLDLFDVHNRRYEMVIASRSSNEPAITQADVNAIIASIRPIPHS